MIETLLLMAVGVVVAMVMVAVSAVLMLFVIGSLGDMIRSLFSK